MLEQGEPGERGLYGQSQYGRVRATDKGKVSHGMVLDAAGLPLLKPCNIYVIKPLRNDSQSVSSNGR